MDKLLNESVLFKNSDISDKIDRLVVRSWPKSMEVVTPDTGGVPTNSLTFEYDARTG